MLLFRHFFSVALYSIWVMFTHPRPITSPGSEKPIMVTPGLDEYPVLVVKAFLVVRSARSFLKSLADSSSSSALDGVRGIRSIVVD